MKYASRRMVVDATERRPDCTAESQGQAPDLGRALRRARLRRRLTLREVETRTGVLNAHISQIEHGQIRRPDIGLVWKLARFYELDFGLLVAWVDGEDAESDERAAYIDAAVRMMVDLDAPTLRRLALHVEELSSPATEARTRARPRLGIGRSGGDRPAAETAVGPVARPPR